MKRAAIEQLLPEVYRRTAREQTPLATLLQLMEDLHSQAETRLERIAEVFDPRRTENRFVPYLASWCDLDHLIPERTAGAGRDGIDVFPLSRLRELTANAAWLSRWRGTLPGLHRFLVLVVDDERIRIDDNAASDGTPRPFHFVVRAAEELRPEQKVLEAAIRSEKAVHATHDLIFQPWPPGCISAPTPKI